RLHRCARRPLRSKQATQQLCRWRLIRLGGERGERGERKWFVLAALELHGPHGGGNLDLLLAGATVQFVDELVPEQVLVAELLYPENHGKINARVAEAMIANDGSLRRLAAGDRAHDLLRHR